ncbi:MAG: MOSC domain-containing protein [Candidatus Eremiobacteraeota bacterium]|nr:MOSC domain-containing protein [Candidatus Eremiobacteraeota bacterium]
MSAALVSVNVGAVRTVRHDGQDVVTGIFKEPVAGRVALRGVNLAGDDQGDRSVHSGPDRAVYAYSTEDYAWWTHELGRESAPGTFGENLTTSGIDVNGALVGERWRIGSAVVQVTTPRFPCYKLAMKMGEPTFVRRFGAALRAGTYLSVVEEGELGSGDAIEVVHRPAHRLTIGEMTKIYLFERSRLAELLVPELPEEWMQWVNEHKA